MADLAKLADSVQYTASEYGEIFVKNLQKAGSVIDYCGIVIPNVVDKVEVPLFNGAEVSVLQPDNLDCSFDDEGDKQEFASKEIEIDRVKINESQCIERLSPLRSKKLWNGGFDDFENTDYYQVMLDDIIRRAAVDMNIEAFGNGTKSVVVKALADPDTIKVEGTTLTVQNIIEELNKVYENMTDAMTLNGFYTEDYDPEMIVSTKTFKLLKQVLATAPTGNNVQLPQLTFTGEGKNIKIYFMSIEIKPNAFIANDTIFVTHTGNMAFVADILDEVGVIKAGRFPAPNENKLWFKGQFGYKVDYIDSEAVLVYQA